MNSHAVARIKFVEFAKVTFATGHEARELAVAIHAIPVAIVRMELMNLIILNWNARQTERGTIASTRFRLKTDYDGGRISVYQSLLRESQVTGPV